MEFEKYQSLGNDFIIISDKDKIDYENKAKILCNRELGIGADGLLVYSLEPLSLKIFNADGSKANLCGNGLRAFCYYLYRHNLISSTSFPVLVDKKEYYLNITSIHPFLCSCNLGKAKLIKELMSKDTIEIESKKIKFSAINLGVNHVIIYVNKEIQDSFEYQNIEKIFLHPFFKGKCNIDLVKINSPSSISLITYEKGCGFTLSCGSGSGASAYVSYLVNNLSPKIEVHNLLGDIEVEIVNEEIIIQGPSAFVFKGEI